MKIFLGVTLALALLIIGFFIIRTYKENHKLTEVVRRILQTGFMIVLCNFISLNFENAWLCILMYSIYFIASDWMLYYLLRFSIEFIGNDFENHVKKKYMILLLLADSASIFINNFTEHLFSLNKVILFGEEVYYELTVKLAFFTHYGIVLMLATFCLISLFYRSVKSPMFYRKKYLAIAVIMVAIVVMNIFSVTSAIDVSVIGYVVEGICLYYCVFAYTPQKLLPKTLVEIAENMSMGLYLLDIDGKNLYINKLAKELFESKEPYVDSKGITLEQWCREQYKNNADEFKEDKSFYKKGEEVIFGINLQKLVDEEGRFQGCYFVLQDRTAEINKFLKEQYLATHDNLTGLYNKEYFYKKVERYIHRHPDEELLMICTDIMDFKMVNDFLGTSTGDVVLKNYAKIIEKYVKGALIYGCLGNDVFGILMSKNDFDENIFMEENQESYFLGMEKNVSFPIVNYTGVYDIVDNSIPVSVMCDRARMAIDTIKGDYQKRIAYYDNKLREDVLHEQELISGLKEAIDDGQIKMYLQPQMTSEGKMVGAEALVRWIHPVKGQIMPGDFIPVFEKNGLISDIDRYMWECACKQLKKWKSEGRDKLYISVNISARDLYFMDIYEIFTKLIAQYDIEAANLKLEITETAIVMDFKRQLELITRLRQKGFIVEMDDFGSGYSSLNMLKDFQVDVLKLDMEFLRKSTDEERSKKIVEMIIELSKRLNMEVITEGVETAEQVAFLSEMGCGLFQGYYFAKPMPLDQFEETYLTV